MIALLQWGGAVLVPAFLFAWPLAADAAGFCPLTSRAQRVALLELYTSEGCNSCPPADRWVSMLPARGFDHSKVVVLAFHVDYWNQLGWVDRFADPRYSARQRATADRQRADVIYTPQFVLDGRDWRARGRDDALAARLAAINVQPPRSAIRAQLRQEAGALHLTGEVFVGDASDRQAAETWVALFENGLASEVRSGENAGKRLQHDFVVRGLIGPLRLPQGGTVTLESRLPLPPDARLERTGVAVFVQRRDNGEILQVAAAGSTCPP